MAKRKKTDNKMVKRKRQTKTWSIEKRTDNKMAERKRQTIKWQNENDRK